MNWKDMEGRGNALIKIMRRNLPRKTEEEFEKFQSG
jgi:hypothetical protein